MAIAYTLKQVADHFSVRPNSISDWRKDGCPALVNAPYDLEAVREWCKKQNRRVKDGSTKPTVTDDLNEMKLRADINLKEVKTELERFRLAVRRGELVDIRDTELALNEEASTFRRELLNMENNFADSLIQVPTKQRVKEKLHEIAVDILNKLSRAGDDAGVTDNRATRRNKKTT